MHGGAGEIDRRHLQEEHVRKEEVEREKDMDEKRCEAERVEDGIQRLLLGGIPASPACTDDAHAEAAESPLAVRLEYLHEEEDGDSSEAPPYAKIGYEADRERDRERDRGIVRGRSELLDRLRRSHINAPPLPYHRRFHLPLCNMRCGPLG